MDDPEDKLKSEGEASSRWVRLVYRRSPTIWQPATDAYETPDRFTVIVELAGMRNGDFTVNLVERRLIITGKRRRPTEKESTAYHQLEIQYGEFRTEVLLPWAVDRAGISASYEDGFLKIVLPRREQSHNIRVVDVGADEDE